jgi:L-threonylcarbamoyladenylate synthase
VKADVAEMRAALVAGGVALVPTDTVYGLAAWLDTRAGVEAVYALKGRPRDEPLQVLVFWRPLLDEALGPLPAAARYAASALLPGPATCIVPDPRGRYAAAAGSAHGTVGLRAPAGEGPLARFDLPLAATSANRPGGPNPATVADVPADLRAGCAAVIDGGRLPGTASAVVDLRGVAAGEPAVLLRPGPDPEAVAAALAGAGCTLVSDHHDDAGRPTA